MLEAIGYIGSAGAATMWIPQAARAWKHRNDPAALAGISLSAYAVAVLFNLLLLTYGIVSEANPVIVAGVVNLICALAIVTLIRVKR